MHDTETKRKPARPNTTLRLVNLFLVNGLAVALLTSHWYELELWTKLDKQGTPDWRMPIIVDGSLIFGLGPKDNVASTMSSRDYLLFRTTTWKTTMTLPTRMFAIRLWPWAALWCALTLRHHFRVVPLEKRRREGLCLRCGYDLRGSPSKRCPECGNLSIR